jgi:uncharacterized protein
MLTFLVIVLVYAGLCALVYVAQPGLIYFPTSDLTATPADRGLAFEDVTIPTADGESIHGWYVPVPDPAGHVLFFHGNAGNISHRLDTVEILHRMGHAVFIIDYRGYGRSSGRPSEAGTYADAAAAWTHLRETRGVDPKRIVVYGRSLGGAVAVWLAANHTPAGLIVESTFTRVADMGAHHYPYLPARWLTRIRYDSLSRMPSVRCEVFSAHSADDEIVPLHLGKALAESARDLNAFVTLAGSHNDSFRRGGGAYYRSLDAFIRRVTDD